jgi:hypothetical protein
MRWTRWRPAILGALCVGHPAASIGYQSAAGPLPTLHIGHIHRQPRLARVTQAENSFNHASACSARNSNHSSVGDVDQSNAARGSSNSSSTSPSTITWRRHIRGDLAQSPRDVLLHLHDRVDHELLGDCHPAAAVSGISEASNAPAATAAQPRYGLDYPSPLRAAHSCGRPVADEGGLERVTGVA